MKSLQLKQPSCTYIGPGFYGEASLYIWEMVGWATINKPWTEKWSKDFHNHLKSWRDSPSKLVFCFFQVLLLLTAGYLYSRLGWLWLNFFFQKHPEFFQGSKRSRMISKRQASCLFACSRISIYIYYRDYIGIVHAYRYMNTCVYLLWWKDVASSRVGGNVGFTFKTRSTWDGGTPKTR